MADGVGFEPTVPRCETLVFETSAFNPDSATHPNVHNVSMWLGGKASNLRLQVQSLASYLLDDPPSLLAALSARRLPVRNRCQALALKTLGVMRRAACRRAAVVA